jgi:hypothetical protein
MGLFEIKILQIGWPRFSRSANLLWVSGAVTLVVGVRDSATHDNALM